MAAWGREARETDIMALVVLSLRVSIFFLILIL